MSDPGDIAHLLRRSGFAALPSEIAALTPLSWNDAVEAVLDTSAMESPFPGVTGLDGERSDKYRDMVWFWLERARTTRTPIVEKMVLFWHGHFCSSRSKVGSDQAMFDQNQTFRTMGLGSFIDLTHAVVAGPAMIAYLDNDRNEIGSPNENLAREVMELFTTGVGHYTEDDVRASARAWTGYGINRDNEAVAEFFADEHDNGSKTFLGQTGNWSGPDTVTIIFQQRRTEVARFIATKMWSFFAYPDPETTIVNTLVDSFRDSMNITDLLRAIFRHDAFRSERAKNGLVRSPIEFVVAAMRHTGLSCAQVNPQWKLGPMGQRPYHPPNVAGWKQNEYWISSSAVWARSSFASGIRWRQYQDGVFEDFDTTAKDADGDTIYRDGGPVLVPEKLDQLLQMALDRYGIPNPSARTRTALRQYLDNEPEPWAHRAGLLMLPVLTPDFQLA